MTQGMPTESGCPMPSGWYHTTVACAPVLALLRPSGMSRAGDDPMAMMLQARHILYHAEHTHTQA
jgi:hypothetical protein